MCASNQLRPIPSTHVKGWIRDLLYLNTLPKQHPSETKQLVSILLLADTRVTRASAT